MKRACTSLRGDLISNNHNLELLYYIYLFNFASVLPMFHFVSECVCVRVICLLFVHIAMASLLRKKSTGRSSRAVCALALKGFPTSAAPSTKMSCKTS